MKTDKAPGKEQFQSLRDSGGVEVVVGKGGTFSAHMTEDVVGRLLVHDAQACPMHLPQTMCQLEEAQACFT